MGMTAALKFAQVVANTRYVLAIEALCAARALEWLRPLRTSPPLEQVFESIRRAAPRPAADAPFTRSIEDMTREIASGELARIVEADV